MSALSILCLVLSFPFAFVFHDGEEAIVQRRWILAHEEKLSGLLPWFRPILKYLSRINTGAFIVAAVEELTVILASTAYSFVKGAYAMEIWSALFMAFSLHLLVHIAQAFVVRGYVPRLFTSFLLLPYAYYGGVQHLPCHVSDGNAYVERCRCYLYGNKPDICPLVGNFHFGTG